TYYAGDFIYYHENTRKLGRIRAIVISEETLKLKVQKTIEYCELPKNFQSNNRQIRSQLGIKLIELQDVIGHASITTSLCRNYESIHNISEILYKLD
ncbi:5524_t:CDS:2, partial [Cetraspora pellucida]